MNNSLIDKIANWFKPPAGEVSTYEEYVRRWRRKTGKPLLIAAGLLVLGAILSFTGIGLAVAVVAGLFLFFEGYKVAGLGLARRNNLKKFEKSGLKEAACESFSQAQQGAAGRMYCAWNRDYLFTDSGVIIPMQAVAWIYKEIQSVNFLFIPLIRIHSIEIKTLDGKGVSLYMGKVKDDEALARILFGIQQVNPKLLIGHSEENQQRYSQLVSDYAAGVKDV